MKKRLLVLGLTGAMLLGMGTSSWVEAKGHTCVFTDKNHDGYCDYGDKHTHRGKHVDANHDGICDKGDGYCMNYRDENGDGVCDYCHGETAHKNHCGRNGNGKRNSGGHHGCHC